MDNKKIMKICVIAIIVIIAIMSIFLGVYFAKLSRPSYLVKTIISKTSDKISNYYVDKKYDFTSSFTVESNIDFELESEEAEKKKNADKKYLERLNIIKNLNSTKNTLLLVQDKDKNKSLMEVKSNINNEEVINYKRLIANSTEYFYLPDVNKNYVNNGTNNYFETLSEKETSIDNIKYLQDHVVESLMNNLKEEYFIKKNTTENINNSSMNVNQISMRINDKIAKEIRKGIINDLKEDTRSNLLLTSIDKDFFKKYSKSKKDIIKKNESYTFNIYTSKYLNKILKYELIYLNEDNKKVYIYEGEEDKGNFYYLENDNLIYTINYNSKDETDELIINNSANEKIGDMKINNNKDQGNFYYDFNFDDGNLKYDIIYSSKYSDFKKNKSYNNEKKLSFKFIDNKVSILSGTITVDSKVNKNVKISEDISNAVLYSTLSEEEKNKYKNKLESINNRLRR